MNFNAAYLFSLVYVAVLVLLFLMVLAGPALEKGFLTAVKQRWALLLSIVVLAFLPALSGCGTAPSPARISPPVPAGLLTPPRPPVLLTPASPSTTPGATMPSMRSGAPKTGSTTSA